MRKFWKYTFIIAGWTIAALIFYNFFLWSPAPEWDPSAEKPIIGIFSSGTEIDTNYIPPVQVWGDGYIVWVKYDPKTYQRKVFEGHLSQAEMKQLVEKLIGLGFFSRFNFPNYDYGHVLMATLHDSYNSQLVNLSSSKFYAFASALGNGAGADGVEFTPKTARLMLAPLKEKEYDESTSQYRKSIPNGHWPAEKFGHTLPSLADKIITGDELEFLWAFVNNNPSPLIESDGKVYWVGISIPKISGYMSTQ